eukprot:scaffold111801_cov57-Phaeocystis_antarctica.AAC.3
MRVVRRVRCWLSVAACLLAQADLLAHGAVSLDSGLRRRELLARWRQTMPQAAPISGQPRPISRLDGSGRPYRPWSRRGAAPVLLAEGLLEASQPSLQVLLLREQRVPRERVQVHLQGHALPGAAAQQAVFETFWSAVVARQGATPDEKARDRRQTETDRETPDLRRGRSGGQVARNIPLAQGWHPPRGRSRAVAWADRESTILSVPHKIDSGRVGRRSTPGLGWAKNI